MAFHVRFFFLFCSAIDLNVKTMKKHAWWLAAHSVFHHENTKIRSSGHIHYGPRVILTFRLAYGVEYEVFDYSYLYPENIRIIHIIASFQGEN